jgi:prevent-host-death family protein
MGRTVKVQEAKTHLSALLAEVEQHGTEITIARGTIPIARLLPIDPGRERDMGFVSYRVPVSFFEPLPDTEIQAWES